MAALNFSGARLRAPWGGRQMDLAVIGHCARTVLHAAAVAPQVLTATGTLYRFARAFAGKSKKIIVIQ